MVDKGHYLDDRWRSIKQATNEQGCEPNYLAVLELGRRIGVAEIYLNHICDQLAGRRAWWNDYLHDLGHFAVKPNSYIDKWWQDGAPGSIPNLNYRVMGNGLIIQERYPFYNQNDRTPDEAGVVAWSLQVLDKFKWRNPVMCSWWEEYKQAGKKNMSWQWSEDRVKSNHHPFYKNGYEQLQAAGIDFAKDNLKYLRPSVEIDFGTMPIAIVRHPRVA